MLFPLLSMLFPAPCCSPLILEVLTSKAHPQRRPAFDPGGQMLASPGHPAGLQGELGTSG